MENKINIAELLKDCPKGMELDCTMFDNVTFVRVDNSRKQFPIEIAVSGIRSKYLTKEGCFHDTTLLPEAKCVIFPKGKTTWEGFVPPCKFKDGDVISVIINKNRWYGIYQKEFNAILHCYVSYSDSAQSLYPSNKNGVCQIDDIAEIRLATEEEKEKLFQAIIDNGYKWNAETNTLEKLIKPKFKVGDRIQWYGTHITQPIRVVESIEWDRYRLDNGNYIKFGDEHAYKLLKFDITTLKPFDKVLVRCGSLDRWRMQFFVKYNETDEYPFVCMWYNRYNQCVPYEGNEHLLDTKDDCNEFYKTLEE